MKKIIASVAVLGLLGGAAQAADTQLVGFVTPVCEAEFTSILLEDFGLDPQAGDSISIPVSLECNSGDGATITLVSEEGGLESDVREDNNANYTATLAAGPVSLSLVTVGAAGPNNQSASTTATFGQLAGGQVGNVTVTLDQTPRFAGGYSDTMSLEITAN